MEGIASIARKAIQKVRGAQVEETSDELAIEEPLEIQLQYEEGGRPRRKVVSVTMRTPGHDEELALGFLFTEGILQDPAQVAGTTLAGGGNQVVVQLQEHVTPVLQQAERNFYTTSSCGVCGKSGIDAIRTVSPFTSQADEILLKPALLYSLPAALDARQALFKITGGLHASALFDLEGNFLLLREDVGRHNALDKLIGTAFMCRQLPWENRILLLSGRASFELIQKAAMAGIKIVAAVGAPSSLAVELAEEAGITLVGFLRGETFNIYSGEQRIAGGS
ncbi:MAG: formate dehydrogenase accessory sulfurtransferase FdhD [Adhaeribacter sp.]